MKIPPQKNQTRVVAGTSRNGGHSQPDGGFRKMPRKKGSGRRRKKRRAQPRDEQGNLVFQRLIVLALSLAGLGLLIVFGFMFLTSPAEAPAASMTAVRPSPSPPAVTRPDSDAAIALTRRMLQAESAEELAPLIHQGQLTSAEALDFIATLPVRELEPLWIGAFDSSVTPMEALLLTHSGAGSGTRPKHLVPLTPDSAGEWRIHFDAFARHSESTFDELVGDRVSGGVFRVVGSRDFYYNSIYLSESEWTCFTLEVGGIDDTIYAYCRRDSVHGRVMREIERLAARKTESIGITLPRGQFPTFRAVLRLAHEAGALPKQFRIASVIADDWVVGERPIDEMERFQSAPLPPPEPPGGR